MKPIILITALVGLLCLLPAHVDARRKFARATGRLFCRIGGTTYPILFARVRLMDQDPGPDDTFGSTRSNALGRFTVSGSAGDLFGDPDPYIEVEYAYSGVFGRMEVENELLRNRKERTRTRGYATSLSFGNIYFSGDHCRAYVNTLKAMMDYRSKTAGRALPYSILKVVSRAPIHGGTPYTTTNKIRIPRGSTYSFSTAKHELAHTVRQSLDGNMAHFLYDVARFRYMQHHSCGKRTNNGFAFNEGWAEFWAGTCYGTYGGSPTQYNYEGNVAKALRALKGRCRASYRQMVNVLARNRGRIHSFPQYRAAFARLYRCR